MANTSGWTHLVRFEHKGVATFGHLVDPKEDGSLEEQFDVAPFATVPLVINTGLNYKDHVTESLLMSAPVIGRAGSVVQGPLADAEWDLFPPRPYIFYRPGTSIAKPFLELVRVYKVQQESLDYEGELVFQTGSRPLKDISVEQAKKEIIGFTVGCNYSPRPYV
jgi:2-keto-4-pentenoate hydratase/2-oxohepta-3-ene-1,7-dioic acid hydratase in catechol pathway